jgi:hypothetical protein
MDGTVKSIEKEDISACLAADPEIAYVFVRGVEEKTRKGTEAGALKRSERRETVYHNGARPPSLGDIEKAKFQPEGCRPDRGSEKPYQTSGIPLHVGAFQE